MEIKDIREMIQQFNDSSLTEMELRDGEFEIYLNKNQASTRAHSPKEATFSTVAAESSAKEKEPAVHSSAEGEVVGSPIVGVVYLQPSPEESPYVVVGEAVSVHQTVCIVEAMKMMNEIPAGREGVITEILVENEQVVGIGDPLFRIR